MGDEQLQYALPSPVRYFPVSRRAFEFSPGLRRLDSLQNDAAQQCLLQIDQQWFDYHQQKHAALNQALSTYRCQQDLNTDTEQHVCQFLIEQLCKEYPQLFSQTSQQTEYCFHNRLNDEKIYYDNAFQLVRTTSFAGDASLLDALCRQLQEDLCIVQFTDHQDYITYLHLCFPNHWAAQDKIGQSFIESHAPVPDMEKINRQAAPLMQSFLRSGPMERFTWGITTDQQLDKHPSRPRNTAIGAALTDYYLRSERQVIIGLPTAKAMLFLIRTYHLALDQLSSEERQRLSMSLTTMSAQTREYKGLTPHFPQLIKLLSEKPV